MFSPFRLKENKIKRNDHTIKGQIYFMHFDKLILVNDACVDGAKRGNKKANSFLILTTFKPIK